MASSDPEEYSLTQAEIDQGWVPPVQPRVTSYSNDASGLAKARADLSAWGGAPDLVRAIDSGSINMSDLTKALYNLRWTTSNPRNTIQLDPILNAANIASGTFKELPWTKFPTANVPSTIEAIAEYAPQIALAAATMGQSIPWQTAALAGGAAGAMSAGIGGRDPITGALLSAAGAGLGAYAAPYVSDAVSGLFGDGSTLTQAASDATSQIAPEAAGASSQFVPFTVSSATPEVVQVVGPATSGIGAGVGAGVGAGLGAGANPPVEQVNVTAPRPVDASGTGAGFGTGLGAGANPPVEQVLVTAPPPPDASGIGAGVGAGVGAGLKEIPLTQPKVDIPQASPLTKPQIEDTSGNLSTFDQIMAGLKAAGLVSAIAGGVGAAGSGSLKIPSQGSAGLAYQPPPIQPPLNTSWQTAYGGAGGTGGAGQGPSGLAGSYAPTTSFAPTTMPRPVMPESFMPRSIPIGPITATPLAPPPVNPANVGSAMDILAAFGAGPGGAPGAGAGAAPAMARGGVPKDARKALLLAQMVRGRRADGGTSGNNLPMDELSRSKRAEKMGMTSTVYHGTHADVPSFDPNEVDIGTHVGTSEQAVNRLRHTSDPLGITKSRGDYGYRVGANIIPLKANIGNFLEMPDVGMWKDSHLVASALVKKGLDLRDVADEAKEIKGQYEDYQDFLDSQENRNFLDELNNHLRDKGYDSIKYKNQVENEYGETTKKRQDVSQHQSYLMDKIRKIEEAARDRMPQPPDVGDPDAEKKMRAFLDAKLEDYLHPHEAKEIKDIEEKHRSLSEDPASYEDPHSYIILDPSKLRSVHAKFDPSRSHESDLLASNGGYIAKAKGGATDNSAPAKKRSPVPSDEIDEKKDDKTPKRLVTGHRKHRALDAPFVDRALELTSKSGSPLPDAVYKNRQFTRGRP